MNNLFARPVSSYLATGAIIIAVFAFILASTGANKNADNLLTTAGSTLLQGPRGRTGLAGPQGLQGFIGDTGVQGDQGDLTNVAIRAGLVGRHDRRKRLVVW